jgi:raffinose/stachyose/melibiose transport system substrate-binding protein
MKSRTLVSVLAIGTATAMLAACSSGGSKSSGGSTGTATASSSSSATGTAPSPSASIGGSLKIISSDTGAIKQIVAAFNKKYPNVNINVTTLDADPLQQQVRTQLASGTGPDLIQTWPGTGNPLTVNVLAKAGYAVDQSNSSWASKYPNSIKSVASYNGKVYAALYAVNGIGAVYNEQALQNAGLTAPTTWTELLKFCADAKAKGTPAFALGLHDAWVTQLIPYALVSTLVYQADPTFDTDMASGKAKFATSGWKDALQKYMDMNKAGCFQQDPLATSYEQTQTLAATGKTLGIVQGNWVISLLKTKNPSDTFTMKPLPATDNAGDTFMATAAGAGFSLNAKSGNKPAAQAFLDFIESPEGMDQYATLEGGVPAIPNSDFKLDPSVASLNDALQSNKTAPFPDQWWPNAKVQQDHLTGIQELFSGQTTIDKLLAKMDADYAQGAGS